MILAKKMSSLCLSLVSERNYRKEHFQQTTEIHKIPSRKTGYRKATLGCSRFVHTLGNRSAPHVTSPRPELRCCVLSALTLAPLTPRAPDFPGC